VDGIDTIFTSLPQYVLTCVVLLGAELVYVLFGFGAGMIAVGALAVVLPEVRDVVVILLLVNFPPELFVVFSQRRMISWRGVLLVCVGIAVGVPIGTAVLRWGRPTVLLLLLGVFLILAGTAFLAVPSRRAVRWPRWTGPVLGLVSGTLSGIFGTGGPPLVLYYQLGGAKKAAFRGNLMAVFLLIGCLRLPSYAVAGLITVPRLWSSLAVLPAVLLGAWIGHRIHIEVSEATFRRLVSAALVLIGAVLLLQRAG